MCVSAKLSGEIEFASEELDIDRQEYLSVCEAADTFAASFGPFGAMKSIVNNAVKVYGLTSIAKQKAKAVRYVGNNKALIAACELEARQEAVRRSAQVETLFIERSYQEACTRIRANADVELARIETRERICLSRIKQECEVHFSEIDYRYKKLIYDQEQLFTLSHLFMKALHEDGLNSFELGKTAMLKLLDEAHRLPPETVKYIALLIDHTLSDAALKSYDAFVSFQESMRTGEMRHSE